MPLRECAKPAALWRWDPWEVRYPDTSTREAAKRYNSQIRGRNGRCQRKAVHFYVPAFVPAVNLAPRLIDVQWRSPTIPALTRIVRPK